MALVAAVRRLAYTRLRENWLKMPAVTSSAWATGQRSFSTGAQPVRFVNVTFINQYNHGGHFPAYLLMSGCLFL